MYTCIVDSNETYENICIHTYRYHIDSSLDVVRRWTHPDDKELVLDGNPITDIRRPRIVGFGQMVLSWSPSVVSCWVMLCPVVSISV